MSALSAWKERISLRWAPFLGFALLVGSLLRLLYTEDMEYKEDEEYHFTRSQSIGTTEPWPWYGIPTGVYIVNPGMSIWVFAALAKIARATTPTALANALQVLSLIGICLILPLIVYCLDQREDREPWLWAFALALVNPFQVLYQRKLWPEPFFPFFTTLMLLGWWKRDRVGGAFVWGLVGAMLGQIHMSGFFFAFAVFLWTAIFKGSELRPQRTRWGAWLTGSCFGAWPLIPWAIHVLRNPVQEKMVTGIGEMLQFKFWSFWITDAVGLHLGNPLGLLRGNSNWAQISDFVRYPLIEGTPTYLVGVAHVVALGAAAVILLAPFWKTLLRRRSTAREAGSGLRPGLLDRLPGRGSETAFLITAAMLGSGALLTLTGVNIRRYYMMVHFPLELVFLACVALRFLPPRTARGLLMALWAAQLFMSASFVGYVHVHDGAPQGDYGDAYHKILGSRQQPQSP